jgi:hypothetical protein
MNTLLLFLLGYIIVQTICLIWFYSPLRTTLGQIFINRHIFSNDEVETWLLLKFPIIGKLLSCYICFSFWSSVLIGILGIFLLNIAMYTPVITALSYPSICYFYKSIVDRS